MNKGIAVKGNIMFETKNRIFIKLTKDIPAKPMRDGLLSARVNHGKYRGTFQSKIIYFGQDLHSQDHILIIDYPAIFRRERRN